MKVSNMTGKNGRAIPNQFIVATTTETYFQSYKSMIARYRRELNESGSEDYTVIELDEKYWDYSKTTSKYRNQFLGMTTQETKKAIKDGTIQLVDLNK